MRLSFGGSKLGEIHVGIERLGGVLRKTLKTSKR
jgi:hypothetical protein